MSNIDESLKKNSQQRFDHNSIKRRIKLMIKELILNNQELKLN